MQTANKIQEEKAQFRLCWETEELEEEAHHLVMSIVSQFQSH